MFQLCNLLLSIPFSTGTMRDLRCIEFSDVGSHVSVRVEGQGLEKGLHVATAVCRALDNSNTGFVEILSHSYR